MCRAQIERMRHEAEESERIRKELQEKLAKMQEEQERTTKGKLYAFFTSFLLQSTVQM